MLIWLPPPTFILLDCLLFNSIFMNAASENCVQYDHRKLGPRDDSFDIISTSLIIYYMMQSTCQCAINAFSLNDDVWYTVRS